MHGNIGEWCEDYFQWEFYQESTIERNPLCENSGSKRRVIRGGYWSNPASNCRSADRYWERTSQNYGSTGFRPAWSSP